MSHSEKTVKFIQILLVFIILITLLIVGYETVIMINPESLYAPVSTQEWACQKIAKDALLIQYGTSDERTIAVNELQNVLPYFEQTQQKIISANKSSSLSVIVRSGQANYVSIDTAAKKMLTTPNKLQLQIITDNEREFFLIQSQALSFIIQEQTAKYYTIFGVVFLGKLIIIISVSIELYLVHKLKGDKVLQNTQDEYPEDRR